MHDEPGIRAESPDAAHGSPVPSVLATVLRSEGEGAGEEVPGRVSDAAGPAGGSAQIFRFGGVEDFRKYFTCDLETGVLTRISTGKPTGSVSKRGYMYVNVRGRNKLAHRVVWWFAHGVWPTGQIDHINGNKTDNRPSNMREVGNMLNQQNMTRARKDNTTGFRGVSRKRSKFCAEIWVEGKKKSLGVFATAEEAHATYMAAKRDMHEGFVLEIDGAQVFKHAGIWHARRQILNGRIVMGIGYTQELAVADLEAQWSVA